MKLLSDLAALGFKPATLLESGDFVLQDDSDGRGPYIRAWLSESDCPFPEAIREPIKPPVEARE